MCDFLLLKIPTFEEINGIKEKLSIEFKEQNPNEFNKAINLLISNVKNKKPTKAHKVLADLQIPIITMNLDGLYQKAGSRFVLEIHGNYKRNNIVLYITLDNISMIEYIHAKGISNHRVNIRDRKSFIRRIF